MMDETTVLDYIHMRIGLACQSLAVEVLANNVVKAAVENGALAELRGIEMFVRTIAQNSE